MKDIVYFVKESDTNEELRYSLRSVCKNFEYRKVWFIGGCPKGLEPDGHIFVNQTQPTKWDRTLNLLRVACQCPDITEDFYLFNDDFFIMKPWKYETVYNGTLQELIERTEERKGKASGYSQRLRRSEVLLHSAGCTTLNYAVHMPLLINKAKALKVLRKFAGCQMFRSLYGNYCNIGGVNKKDCKIMDLEKEPGHNAKLLSTCDNSFNKGRVGQYIRSQFTEPCKYEK